MNPENTNLAKVIEYFTRTDFIDKHKLSFHDILLEIADLERAGWDMDAIFANLEKDGYQLKEFSYETFSAKAQEKAHINWDALFADKYGPAPTSEKEAIHPVPGGMD